ncbi:type II toxin-antitoxin system mRNA interferase toxin, RelE/StbE family [Candidatus Uhrbacteria bacterium]|nr:type II toxin-antitoxin system mRNA interferase toxin, RelE/StbE family [Candidatus Uhrbacteria bacterium]
MKVVFHKRFKRQVAKYPALSSQLDERIALFVNDPFHPMLNNHQLAGKWARYRSINITGDYRAIYESVKDDLAYFVDLDTHGNLYR